MRIGGLLVSEAQKIVDTNVIELRQSNKNLGWDHAFTAFVVSIGSLRNIDLLADFRLCEVRIFS